MIDKQKIGFVYKFECFAADGTKKWEETAENLLPNESVAYFLNTGLAGGTQLTSWYVGLLDEAHVPAITDTMTTMVAKEADAYSGTNRIALTPDAIAGGVFANVAAPSEFTFTGGATIRGGFITSNITRGNTSGLLLSVVALSSPKVMAATDVLQVTAGLALATV